jgi:hypothetical protein
MAYNTGVTLFDRLSLGGQLLSPISAEMSGVIIPAIGRQIDRLCFEAAGIAAS